MCMPVLPDVLGYAGTCHSSQTCLTTFAVCTTCLKLTPSGSRSITTQSGWLSLPTREFQGLISMQPSCTIYSRVLRSPPFIQCRLALLDSENISALGTQPGKCSLFFWKNPWPV